MKIAPLAAALFLVLAAPTAFAAQHGPLEKIQERNAQLQILMGQAQHAKAPAERQAIMAEYMKTMQLQMAAMKEVTGPNGTTADQPRSALSDEASLQMQATMQSMMQMFMQMTMQMMMQAMQQMMQQQSASNPAP